MAEASTIEYPFDGKPPFGGLQEVAPGVHWLRLALPYALDHVNVWLLDEEDGGFSLIDCGIGDARTRAVWQTLFDGPLAGRRCHTLLVTHYHPDHAGNAGWLSARLGVTVCMPQSEYLTMRVLGLDHSARFVGQMVEHYRASGIDEAAIQAVEARGHAYAHAVDPLIDRYSRVHDGQKLRLGGRDWRVIIGLGHAPEMACLYSERDGILLAADQILPRISPNISVWPSEPDADPLAAFLGCAGAFAALPSDTLVLPSHGRPFIGLHERVHELVQHHDERLRTVVELCAEPVTVDAVMRGMFERQLDIQQTAFALGEAWAHLNYLRLRGRLRLWRDDAGLWRHQQVRAG